MRGENMSIPTIAAMVLVLLLTIIVPLGVMAFLHRRGGSWKCFLVGAVTFTVFAVGLEPILHNLVLSSETGQAILGNIWLYGLYGGLAAGIFEETGRFLAFRFVLKNRNERITALSYGIGHGGIEAFLITGLSMASNLVLGLLYANGAALPENLTPSLEILLTTPAQMFLWAGIERLSAMTLHMALSVLVFASLRTGRRWLFPAAILLHGAMDFAGVVSNAYLPVAATEGLILAAAVLAAVWASQIYKKMPEIAENT